MQRRQLLKLSPLAALAALPIKVEGEQPQAFEVKPDKKYIFIFSEFAHADSVRGFGDAMKEIGVRGVVVIGHPQDLTIYEVDAK